MARLDGKVAVISGAARGQGRAEAVALAREGASIVAFDICEPLRSPRHPAATEEDLQETARLVEQEGQACIAVKADARDLPALENLADRAVTELGSVDVLVVNHGIWAVAESSLTLSEEDWQESIDILLTGAWKVTRAFIPKIIDGGRGGAVVLTSSLMGFKAHPSSIAYTAAKHGIIGLMRTLAWEFGEQAIRVNAIVPGTIDTPLSMEGDSIEVSSRWHPRFYGTDRTLLPDGLIPTEQVARAVVYLTSDDSAYVTGAALPVDAGFLNF
ncbi:MAG: mycofactocin-coupled SDR family oxidoreductase [Actinobacteria bacterium]|nr:mycofactocin-coupled SDR family oxidoreductase [Actinomycetota bacterium]